MGAISLKFRILSAFEFLECVDGKMIVSERELLKAWSVNADTFLIGSDQIPDETFEEIDVEVLYGGETFRGTLYSDDEPDHDLYVEVISKNAIVEKIRELIDERVFLDFFDISHSG